MRIALVVAASVVMATASQASLLVYDGFNYIIGSLSGQSGGGSFGFSGAWSATNASVASGSMSYPVGTTVTASGNSVQGTAMSAWRFLDPANYIDIYAAPNKTVYVSLLLRKNDGAASADWLSVGFARSATPGSGTATEATLTGSLGYGSNELAMVSRLNVLSSSVGFGSAIYDETRLFVLKLVVSGGNRLDYYVSALNAAPGVTEPAVWGTAQNWTPTSDTVLDRIGIFSGTNGTTVGRIDEIRVGTTWQDVTAGAVPEPATMSLLGLGGLLLMRRRVQ